MCGRTSLVCGYLTFVQVDHVKPSFYTTEIWFPLIHLYTYHHLRTVHYITQYIFYRTRKQCTPIHESLTRALHFELDRW